MGYCYKTNLSNQLLKCSVVGVSLTEFTFKQLSPSLNLSTETFKNFLLLLLGKERKKNSMLFFSVSKQMLLKCITPYLTGIKKEKGKPSETGHRFSSTAQKPPCQHLELQHNCNTTATALIAHTLFSASKLWRGGVKTESERAKESSSSEPLMTRAKHVEGKSPNSVYSFSIPWRAAKLNISAG